MHFTYCITKLLSFGHPSTKDIVQLVWVTLSLYLLGVHTEVDERIEGGVGHGQPEEGQEDVLGVLVTHHRLEIYSSHLSFN